MKDTIAKSVKDNYGLQVKEVLTAPRGFVAETYYIITEDKKYFLKLRKNDENSFNKSLRALCEFNQSGIGGISEIVLNRDGQVTTDFHNRAFALFDYVPGTITTNYNPTKLAEIIKQLHESSSEYAVEETYDLSYHKKYLKLLKSASRCNFKPFQKLKNETGTFEQLFEKLLELRQSFIDKDYAKVPTHGDAHNNVMLSKDSMVLVDWDSVMLAPKERDLWFFEGNNKFLESYFESNNVRLDTNFVLYYQLSRLFSDLNGFAEAILGSNDANIQNKNFHMLEETIFGWLIPLVQRRLRK